MSIHLLYPLMTLGRSPVHHRATQRHTNTHTVTPRDNLETPINLTCMLLDNGWKPENIQTPHSKTPAGNRIWNSCCEATVLTTTTHWNVKQQILNSGILAEIVSLFGQDLNAINLICRYNVKMNKD